jgi:hypothetical protein
LRAKVPPNSPIRPLIVLAEDSGNVDEERGVMEGSCGVSAPAEGFIELLDPMLFFAQILFGHKGDASRATPRRQSVPDRNPDLIGETLAKILDDPASARRLGEQARAQAIEKWQWPRSIERLERYLMEEIEKSGSHGDR